MPKSRSSSTVSSFWKEHASETRAGNVSTQKRTISSALIASTSRGSCSVGVANEHLLQRVAAQAEPERLERDDLFRRDVPEIHVRTEVLDEPGLRRLRGRLPDEVVEVDRVLDLLD